MTADVLSDRALNRATLARQHLLARADLDPVAAVEHLVGLQAQEPFDPYLALWSRLAPFDPHALGRRLEDRTLVRIVVMRGTVHLVTAADAVALRPLMQPVLDGQMRRHSEFAPQLVGVDVAPVMAEVEGWLVEQPRSTRELRTLIEEGLPGQPAAALAHAARTCLPLVQVPPRAVWGQRRQVVLAPLSTWVDRPVPGLPPVGGGGWSDGPPEPDLATLDRTVLRYLRAFGPATVADVGTWCRLTGMREVVERLRHGLRTFRDERGRELFDVPDGLLVPEDVPVPVRVLPEYDNVLLSHADRSRFGDIAAAYQANGAKGPILVGGEARATWHTELDKASGAASVVVHHLRLTRRQASSVEAEVRRMARFWLEDATSHDVRLVPIP